jgi:DNA-directed RNA polymerase specialized sigma24 family protein
VVSTDFEDILGEQTPKTQAVVRLTVMGFPDSEIAERLKLTGATVRRRRPRFRTALCQAAREHRIRIPEEPHTKTVSRRHQHQQPGAV